MKVYVGNRKTGTSESLGYLANKAQYGMTVYSDSGDILYSTTFYDELSDNKFENALKAIEWAVKKFKTLTQNKVLSSEENTIFVVGSKTVYGWIENGVAPEPYTVLLSDILLEMSFIFNPLEVILSGSVDRRVLYRESHEDKGVKATDLFGKN